MKSHPREVWVIVTEKLKFTEATKMLYKNKKHPQEARVTLLERAIVILRGIGDIIKTD